MKKLLALSLIGSSLLLGSNPAKADTWDHWALKYFSVNDVRGFGLYTVESETGSSTLRTTKCFVDSGINECEAAIGNGSYLDATTGKLFIENQSGEFHSYDLLNDTWKDEGSAWTSNYLQNGTFKRPSVVGNSDGSVKIEMSGSKIYEKKSDGSIQIGSDTDDIDVVADGLNIDGGAVITKNADGSVQLGADGNDIDVVADGLNIDGGAVITKNADGSVQIGADGNDVDITAEGISVGGEPLVSRKSNGELHIGKNSWITKEENGRQKVYAKDANGNPIPIDYTNGTKLLINGRDVEQSINNVGALSAALTGLPTVPTDTTLACGLGTGTHGGDFAFSGGCASKVNEKLSINYAASMTIPGQDYAGDFEDQFSARAGFVWKLGKATKPTQISMKETKELKKEISDLKENNKNIIAQNNALLARLERLEKVALGDLKSKDLAVYPLK